MNRRRFLVGGLGLSTLGAVGAAASVRTGPIESWTPSPDTWPLARFGPANNAGNAGASAPADPSVAWTTNVGVWELGSLVVGTDAVYVGGRRSAAALDRRTGAVRWSRGIEYTAGVGLALRRGTLFAGSGTASAQLIDVDPVGLTALDARSGRPQWHADYVGSTTHIVVADDTVFVGYFSHDLSLAAYDAGNGSLRWTITQEGTYNYPVVHDGSLSAALEDVVSHYGRRSLLDAVLDSTPRPAWRHPLSVSPRPPTVVDDLILYGGMRWNADEPIVFAVDATDGDLVWDAFRSPEERAVATTPSVVGDRGFTGLRIGDPPGNRAVAAVSIADGSVIWRRRIDHLVTGIAASGDAVIVATTADPGNVSPGSIRALDPVDGNVRWRIDFDRVVHSVAVVDGAVFATVGTGRVVALR